MIDWQLDYGLESLMWPPHWIISPVWAQTWILCRGVTLSYLSSALCCRLHSSSCSSGYRGLSVHRLLQAALSVRIRIRNVCHHKDFPDLLNPPVSRLTPTEPQTSAAWLAQPFSLWMGAWKDAAAEWEHRHGNTDAEDHIIIFELHVLFWSTCLRKKKTRPKTHFKSKVCKLIILL